MIRLLLSFIIVFLVSPVLAQFTSNTDGDWETDGTWSGGSSPGLTSISVDVTINSYVTASDDVSLEGITFVTNASLDLIVNDTLIVYGDITFPSNKNDAQINVGANNVLIVFGDVFMGKNNAGINVEAGSVVVITGSVTDTGGGGNQIGLVGDGNTYIGGSSGDIDSSGATEGIDAIGDIGGTGGDGFESIDEFVNGGGSTPLPITLKEFTVQPKNSSAILNWTTLTEENFEYFEIQRAAEDGEFSVLATVAGNGFSKEEINYSWADENPRLGINYYRLESVDYDGYREIFQTIAIIYEPENRKVQISPNPIALNSSFKLQNTFGERFSLKILNLNGRVVLENDGTNNIFSLPTNLKSGIYLAQFEVNGLHKTQKLIIQ